MPIELPPLSRRAFLGAMGSAAGAGLAALSGCAAGSHTVGPSPRQRRHDRVLLLADTHINADPATTSRDGTVNMADQLAAVIRDVHQHVGYGGRFLQQKGPVYELDYDFALVNGDDAHLDGQLGDYRLLVELLDPLRASGVPVHLTLGNHDDRHAFREALEAPPSAMALKHVRRLGAADNARYADWYLLDSLRHVNETPGTLGGDQLAWLDQQLGTHASKPALIAVHHHVLEPDPDEEPWGLLDADALFGVVERHRHVRAIFYGHQHRWNLASRDGVAVVGLPPTSYVFRQGDPWGHVIAEVDRSGMTLTLRAMDGHPADGQAARVPFG